MEKNSRKGKRKGLNLKRVVSKGITKRSHLRGMEIHEGGVFQKTKEQLESPEAC